MYQLIHHAWKVRQVSLCRRGLLLLLLLHMSSSALSDSLRPEFLRISSGSMAPTFPVGSVVLVAPYKDSKPAVGDVILMDHPDYPKAPLCHRVVHVEKDWVITRGDANRANDRPVYLSSIRGKVAGSAPPR